MGVLIHLMDQYQAEGDAECTIEQTQVDMGELAITLPKEVVQRLIIEGHLTASEIRPLNQAAKLHIQRFCLSACQGKTCGACIFQRQCTFSMTIASKK